MAITDKRWGREQEDRQGEEDWGENSGERAREWWNGMGILSREEKKRQNGVGLKWGEFVQICVRIDEVLLGPPDVPNGLFSITQSGCEVLHNSKIMNLWEPQRQYGRVIFLPTNTGFCHVQQLNGERGDRCSRQATGSSWRSTTVSCFIISVTPCQNDWRLGHCQKT